MLGTRVHVSVKGKYRYHFAELRYLLAGDFMCSYTFHPLGIGGVSALQILETFTEERRFEICFFGTIEHIL